MGHGTIHQAVAEGFMIRQCPATSGTKTRTTEAWWKRTCSAFYTDQTRLYRHGESLVPSYCTVCKEKCIPAEVQFVSLDELMPPGTKIVASKPRKRSRRKILATKLKQSDFDILRRKVDDC